MWTSDDIPFSLFDSMDPEDLWAHLAAYEERTGGRAFAIPHNGNLSNGLMFSDKDFSGNDMDQAYAAARLHWDPLMEISQIKGDGETHPLLSTEDEFADYETWDGSNIDGSAPKEEWMLQYEYGRSALKLGLQLGSRLGANPYMFGITAATDAHTALATTRDEVVLPDFTSEGYSRGVPMGGTLVDAPDGAAPRFLIRALRDPDGANLDRVQVIKGWLDDDGEAHERIYDVAVSDDREIDADGRAREPVRNTVDIATASYTNTAGDAMQAAHWVDPDFDPREAAFYYVRVLQIPTPRWTTYDAAFFDIDLPDNVPATIQDRAYTSPIWYTP